MRDHAGAGIHGLLRPLRPAAGLAELSAICVWKYDRQHPNQAIEGAVFQVKYLSGNTSGTGGTVIGTYRTSANGSFTVTGLKKGTYIISELSSDGDHVVDTPPQTVYLSGQEQEVIQVYFGNSAKGALLVKKVDAGSGAPLSDVEFLVTESDGSVVGDANGKFVTDSAGTFAINGIEPGATLIVKETRAKPGYLLDNTPQTVQVKAGQTVTLEFRNQKQGNLIIHKLSGADKKTPLEGVQFKITYADGRVVDAEGGKLSSNGLYTTNKEGQIILSGITGTIICTEVASIPGFTIDPGTRSQTIVVNPGDDTQHLYFYNDPVGGVEIIKVREDDRSVRIPNVTFEIRRMDGGLVGKLTTGSDGRASLPLEAGSYYAVEIECPKEYKLDAAPHYFTVRDGKSATLRLSDIDKEIAHISGQNLALSRLKSKGCIDSALALSQADELSRKLRDRRRLRRKLLETASGDEQIRATEAMLDYLEAARWQDEADPEWFGNLVDRITVASAEEVSFRLPNGLELAERLV